MGVDAKAGEAGVGCPRPWQPQTHLLVKNEACADDLAQLPYLSILLHSHPPAYWTVAIKGSSGKIPHCCLNEHYQGTLKNS